MPARATFRPKSKSKGDTKSRVDRDYSRDVESMNLGGRGRLQADRARDSRPSGSNYDDWRSTTKHGTNQTPNAFPNLPSAPCGYVTGDHTPSPVGPRRRRGSLLCPGTFVKRREGLFSEHYIGERVLGKGTFGRVVESVDRVTGQRYAVKVIAKSVVRKTGSLEEFVREVSFLRELDHPAIMKVHEYFEEDDYLYLVSDLYTGGELFEEIIRRTLFSELEAVVIMRQLLSGIAYMHEKSITHRDLKPENILLTRRGDINGIRIIDLGLAAYTTNTVQGVQQKAVLNAKTGTAYYIAPDVMRGEYNESCDIWSAGVILYILLSGCPPFYGKDEADILQRVKVGRYTFRIAQFDKVTAEAKQVIRNMLIFYPADRPSARELMRAPWFHKGPKLSRGQSQDESRWVPRFTNLIHNVKCLLKESALTRLLILFSASKLLPLAHIENYKPLFDSINKTLNGRLSVEEVRNALEKYYLADGSVPPHRASQDARLVAGEFFDALDFNCDLHIEYSEYICAACNKEETLAHKQLKRAFDALDVTSKGYLTSDDFWAFIKDSQGARYLDANQMFQDGVPNGTERLTFDVLVSHCHRLSW